LEDWQPGTTVSGQIEEEARSEFAKRGCVVAVLHWGGQSEKKTREENMNHQLKGEEEPTNG